MLSQLMMVFGFFALVLVSVYWVNSAVRLFDRLISDNQSVWVFLELTALTLPNVIRLMLPVAAFVAVLYTTQRMTGESELVVMQATGFSPFRLARPVLYFGIVVALLISVLAHVLVPMARTRLNERNAEINDNVTARFLTEGTLLHPGSGLTLYIRAIGPTGELDDVFLFFFNDTATTEIYTATRAYLTRSGSGPKLVMFDGMAQTLASGSRSLSLTRFQDFTYDIGALMAARGPRAATLDEWMTPALLWPDAQRLAETGASPAEAIFHGHDRFAKPLMAIAGVMIGFAALIGSNYSRFGMWRPMLLASGLYVGLYLLMNLMDRTAARGDGWVVLVYAPALAGLLVTGGLFLWSVRRRAVARAPRLPADGVLPT